MADVNRSDTAGLRTLRDRLGPKFVTGLLLHCGDRVQWLEDRIVALPIAALWTAGASTS